MNKIKFYFIVLIAAVISSCNKNDDDIVITPPRDYTLQYNDDIAAIEGFLKTNYISEIVVHPGFPDDQDVTMEVIPAGENHPSLWSYLDSPTLPRLSSREVLGSGGVTYKIYTLLIREGVNSGGTNPVGGEYPCNLDAVFAGYKGTLLDGTVFDSSNDGQIQWDLYSSGIIRGWSEAFPQFKTGWVSSNDNGTIRYNDFGVGVMFLPSAMGYYSQSIGSIPSYSPLVFSIKLYALKRMDQDADGIPSYQEDFDGDRYMYYYPLADIGKNPDDTDKDGTPDCFDFDDDGDGYATRGEVKDINGDYYPFDLIPDCSGDQTTVTRKKRHLDPDCHKMSQ